MGRLSKTAKFCLAILITYYANPSWGVRNLHVPQGALHIDNNWQEPHVPHPDLLVETQANLPIQNFCLKDNSIESTVEMTVCKSWADDQCIEYAQEIIEIPLTNENEFCSHWTVENSQGTDEDFGADYDEALEYHLYNEATTEAPFCLPEHQGRVVDYQGLSNSNGRPALFEVQFEAQEDNYQILTCEFVESTATLNNEVILTGGEHSGGGKRNKD